MGVHGRRSRTAQGRAGVTLVEILVSTAVLAAVLVLVAAPLILAFSFFYKTTARVDAQRAARRAMSAVTRDLAEAMYVFDVPPSGTQLAFVAPKPTGDGVTAPAPGAVVRYWLALVTPQNRDDGSPESYKPYYTLAEQGGVPIPDRFADPPYYPRFVARCEVDDPWNTSGDDDWNNTDPTWGLIRATYFHPDAYEYPGGGDTWPESQPGYPWLEAVRLYPSGGPNWIENRATYYRERAVAITPTEPTYDVPELRFAPARMSDETLAPRSSVYPRDHSLYIARYGMWAGFAAPVWQAGSLVWEPVGGEQEGSGIRIYRGETLVYQTKVRASDGSVWVCGTTHPGDDPGEDGAYNTRDYPQRLLGSAVAAAERQHGAFQIDYDGGRINFAFSVDEEITPTGAVAYPLDAVASAIDVLDPLTQPNGVVIPGSDRVFVDGELYRRVDGVPGVGEYRLEGTSLYFSPTSPPAGTISVHYEYRNNQSSAGVADIVVATYATKRLMDVTVLVSKRDRAARREPERARQEFGVTTRVEVRNTPQ